ncbi:MAG: CBS domain-containing protein [Candidatus Omnitrophica bacterium]|nr:CBS domain-containing protein [Candidatus Omnitrophota bacterium]
MTKVAEIMTKKVIKVYPSTPVYDAANMLLESSISGMPVVDYAGHLVGIVSEKDVLKLLFAKDEDGKVVADFMTINVKTFDADEDIEKLCTFFMKNPFRRVPIVDKGRLLGIVSRRDILTFILKKRGKDKKVEHRTTMED